MKVEIETVVDGEGRALAAWGLEGGRPVLLVIVGSRRVRVVCEDAEQARQIGCGGIFVAGILDQERARSVGRVQGAASSILGADGLPSSRKAD